jgi:hypothetical protein
MREDQKRDDSREDSCNLPAGLALIVIKMCHQWGRYIELQKQARRAKRYARYEDVRTLSGQGVSMREIARRVKLSRETIRRFLRVEAFPEIASGRRGQRGSILNPYKPYIFQRRQQGCRNSVQFYDEIKTHGYSGSTSLLRNLSSKSSEKACGGRISGSVDL